ncbi:Gfo/Idh/MocA family oxidoreductase [Gemmatimonas sp.]|uniref:Gfo/Idh/MocA family protein n=1 Tax=Gemmatimonas sp. TaxID=1962908 RepID=UPI0025C637DC|nr:Gfo/Idh/MocA family oxidoreductase [Gemmatimonas sp.]MCA2988865.1 Gfo/Idh/MocA family oxidoreductase [Gemmatimonas sp.]MCA2993148.1 Gfo/Idh/MocA family oxidoreductase [Gemmatimonas sp.]
MTVRDSVVHVGLLGAGAWAHGAHLPGYARDPRCKVVAIADPVREKADAFAREFGIPHVYDSHEALLAHHGLDAVDVCTPSATHFALSWAALEAGKHVLCEKPVAYDYAETRRAAALAAAKGLKTKLGFTFRYSPGMRYMKALIDEGFIGEPFIFNGFEQNSQWLDPQNPLRQVDHTADQSSIQVSSLEGYGAPIMDIGHLCMGSRFAQVVGTMKNFIPERMVRATGTMMRMNIDDGDIFIGEFANGAIGSIQTSFVTVGNYPGIEARVYGSKGALICRMVEENGVAETLKAASADAVEFRELEIPQRFYPTGGSPRESWRSLFYANLTHSFISEIRGDVAGNEGNFEDGAHVQELINAVERSYRQRRWVSIPLERDGVA